MRTERLQYREDNLTAGRINGQSFEVVKSSVRAGIVLLIQAVKIHHAEQLLAINRPFVDILHVRTDRIVAVGDIKFKFILVNTGCSQGIDILHHEVPCTAVFLTRRIGAGLQHLKCQCIRCT